MSILSDFFELRRRELSQLRERVTELERKQALDAESIQNLQLLLDQAQETIRTNRTSWSGLSGLPENYEQIAGIPGYPISEVDETA